MNYDRKCTLILEWANTTNPKFDTTAVSSIMEWGQVHGYTPAQETAIDNIFKKWQIAAWAKRQ